MSRKQSSPGEDFLPTGAVARLLGSSRQHVVDMCTRGELPFVWAGRHRRIPRSAVDACLGRTHDELTRDQERSLWLYRALLGRMVTNPDQVLQVARDNTSRLLQQAQPSMTTYWLRQWQRVLDQGVDAVADVLTSRSPLALELRQNSPSAGALPQETRSQVLAAFIKHWRADHARTPTPPPLIEQRSASAADTLVGA